MHALTSCSTIRCQTHTHSQALLVTERELKMWQLVTSNENDFYMCLPKGSNGGGNGSGSWKIENGPTNCYVVTQSHRQAVVNGTTLLHTKAQLKEEVVASAAAAAGSHRKLYMNIVKAPECDNIVRVATEQNNNNNNRTGRGEDREQLKLYGSSTSTICGIEKEDNSAKEYLDQNEQVK